MFGPLAKWAARIDDARRIPEYVARAFQVATSGRHGPVVLALPEDMLAEEVQVADAKPYTPSVSHPGREAMEHFRQLLGAAQRPMVLLGGPGWTRESCNDMQRFVEANALPTACAFRFQDLIDNRHPNYVGDVGVAVNPILANRIRACDLLIAVGPRLGEATTSGYTIVESPVPRQKLVHVHAGADEIGAVFQPELGIVSDMAPFARSVAAMEPIANPPWKAALAEARADYEAYSARREMPGRVQLCDVVAWLDQHVPEDTIIANGAGNFAVWMHRFHRYTGWRTQLGPTSGAMGYGLPAAIAAKLARPERTVIAWCGDGEFQMTGQELGTAVQHGAAVIAIIINNGMYGTIRMHQEKHYPGRVSGTELVNPQFAAYARAFGAVGEIVEETAQFGPAFERCVASGKPAVIEIRIDPQAITPNTTLDALRAASRK